jgi:hypothetical protein
MHMRTLYITGVLTAVLGLASCQSRRDEPAARQAGREAYRATQDIKRGAKEAAQGIRKAGKELREGWNDAKRDDARKK